MKFFLTLFIESCKAKIEIRFRLPLSHQSSQKDARTSEVGSSLEHCRQQNHCTWKNHFLPLIETLLTLYLSLSISVSLSPAAVPQRFTLFLSLLLFLGIEFYHSKSHKPYRAQDGNKIFFKLATIIQGFEVNLLFFLSGIFFITLNNHFSD